MPSIWHLFSLGVYQVKTEEAKHVREGLDWVLLYFFCEDHLRDKRLKKRDVVVC